MTEPLATLLARADDASLEAAEEAAPALAHDVGKYVARVARNVKVGMPVPPGLVPMLAKDLYETHRGVRASVHFGELRRALPPAIAEAAELAEVHARLARVDALEPAVRGGEAVAVESALALAREVDATLGAFARAIRAERAAREAAAAACLPPPRGARG